MERQISKIYLLTLFSETKYKTKNEMMKTLFFNGSLELNKVYD